MSNLKAQQLCYLAFLLLLGIHACFQSDKPKILSTVKSNPEHIGRLLVGGLLERKEMMMYRTSFLNTVHYAEAFAGLGAMRLARLLNDTALIVGLENRFHAVLDHFDTLPANHVDANVIGVLPLQLYQWNGNQNYLRMGLRMADIQWENPLPNGLSNQTRWWIDDMYMIGILQIEAYKVTNNMVYLERAALEIDAYLQKLQQSNGLFYHGPDAPMFWGRGNGWVAAALAEIIAVLPPENTQYASILSGYRRMMEALIEYQTPGGMWRQLIDREEAWEESSCTAMFGHAIKMGIDKGLLKGRKYKEAYQSAWHALVKRINDEGRLTGICVGTGQSTDIQYYLDRPTVTGDLHGQAPVLWFAYSLVETGFTD